MKKIISLILVFVCTATCALALSACSGGNTIPQYYGKTITFTGNALPISWDKKCQKDNGPDNFWNESKNDLNDENDYSYRELLTKYWDRIDFDHENPDMGKVWSSMKGKTVDEFIAEIDQGLDGFYDGIMNLSTSLKFEFGSKDSRTLKITISDDGKDTVYNTKFVENDAQLQEEKSKFDPRAIYLTQMMSPNNTGHWCIAFIDSDDDGLYDGYFSIIITAYVVLDNKTTAEVSMCMMDGLNEYDGSLYSYSFGFQEINARMCLWGYPDENGGANSIITLPFYPEIVIE